MKKTHKKIVGFLGLLAVAAVTTAAVFMPAPETQATSSVTDTIVVQVVNEVPDVSISGLPNKEVITAPVQTFTVNYENVHTTMLKLKHTSLSGEVNEYVLDEFTPNYESGSKYYTVFFKEN